MSAKSILTAVPDRAVIFIRAMVGGVFLSEGLQEFVFSAELGAGRFAKLGLPHPPPDSANWRATGPLPELASDHG